MGNAYAESAQLPVGHHGGAEPIGTTSASMPGDVINKEHTSKCNRRPVKTRTANMGARGIHIIETWTKKVNTNDCCFKRCAGSVLSTENLMVYKTGETKADASIRCIRKKVIDATKS